MRWAAYFHYIMLCFRDYIMLCFMDDIMLGFLLVVAMHWRVHRVYVRMVCLSDGSGSIFGGVAMALKSGPNFEPVFRPQKWTRKV